MVQSLKRFEAAESEAANAKQDTNRKEGGSAVSRTYSLLVEVPPGLVRQVGVQAQHVGLRQQRFPSLDTTNTVLPCPDTQIDKPRVQTGSLAVSAEGRAVY